ncbi:hypothetical protein GE09DRAFT_560777 [Coniochaeta sp. 2T2.1]|nr:hypothetical protein GE09DRAFT_560777 [Coniochaeta sp. 2T2.1]
MEDSMSPNGEPVRKRLRTSHACDVCRSRKIRCDGNNPCTTCKANDTHCTYGSEANSRGKSDLILEGVLRVEKYLQQLSANLTTASSSPPVYRNGGANGHHNSIISPILQSTTSSTSPAFPPTRGSFSGHSSHSPLTTTQPHPHPHAHHPHPPHRPPSPITSPPGPPAPPVSSTLNLENAVLDSMHTSTTESVLQWPHFDVFPSLRDKYTTIFHLEASRPPFRTRQMSMCPYAGPQEVDSVFDAFEHGVNFWYPTVSRGQLKALRGVMVGDNGSGGEGLGLGLGGLGGEGAGEVQRCLALLTMALGCASQVIGGLVDGQSMGEAEMERRRARREVADRYFDCVMRMLHVAHTDVSPAATHCLLFVALYFAFLRRPLQAWEYINAAAAKCLLLLSYPPSAESHEETERIRRIFWSCYILESDYLAELSVPVSGVGRIESSIPLPGVYPFSTHQSQQEEEQSSLYFLACISMRRLLNRVHQLLYARDTGSACNFASSLSSNDVRFPVVVAELDHQLEEWRDVLPAAFAFDVGFEHERTAGKRHGEGGGGVGLVSEHGGFLRQRYLTCRSVIYRPYLMWMLSGAGDGGSGVVGGIGGGRVPVSEEVLRNCKACLDACLLHILNLRGFAHTVLVDTWICSLSMAAAMLVLLAACRMPALRGLIGPEVLLAGDHLMHLFEGWQRVSGDPSSPSVDQSVRVIGESARFIGEVYGREHRQAGL